MMHTADSFFRSEHSVWSFQKDIFSSGYYKLIGAFIWSKRALVLLDLSRIAVVQLRVSMAAIARGRILNTIMVLACWYVRMGSTTATTEKMKNRANFLAT